MGASPQLADGYTPIANEILEHLMKAHLSANQWQVLLCIIRKTYGFHKKVDYIANKQICDATGLCKAVVSRCLAGLDEAALIIRKGKYIGFQKDWTQWKLAEQLTLDSKLAVQSTSDKLAEQSTNVSNPADELTKQVTKVSTPAVAQKKDTTTKETIQKKPYGQFKNVKLTDKEYEAIVERFGELDAKDRIEKLSLYIASRGDKYKSHYATILAWEKRDKESGRGTDKQRPRQLTPRHQYHKPDEY